MVKTEQARKSFQAVRDDFDQQNRLLLLELPQFYEKRIDYFQPCLQALIRYPFCTVIFAQNDWCFLLFSLFSRSQVDYYGETTRLFTHLVSMNPDASSLMSDEEHREEVDGILGEIKGLSIVGN